MPIRGFNLNETSNPALRNSEAFGSISAAETASINGVVNKTGILTVLTVIGGVAGVWIAQKFALSQGVLMGWGMGTFLTTLLLYFVVFQNPMRAVVIAPIYAVIQGSFLGVITMFIDRWLANSGYLAAGDVVTSGADGVASSGYVAIGGVALQAFVITMAILVSMLTLYYFRILQATPMFKRVVFTLVIGIIITYVVSMILSWFKVYMPFISVFTTPTDGSGMWIGMAINLFILLVASLMLIIDFKRIEDHVKAGSPKRIEWYLGFCLLITLIWIYYEAVQLSARIAILAGGRE